MSPETQLAWESRWRIRAVVVAAIAAALPLIGAILGTIATRGERAPNNSVDKLLFYDKHSAAFLSAAVLQALGAIAIAGVLVYLFKATKARREETPQFAYAIAIGGPVLNAVSQIALYGYLLSKAHDFATSGKLFYPQAHAILSSGTLTAFSLGGLIGQFGLAIALILISLNAMRSGLLTRFLGVLGIIVGVLFVIPIGTPLPIVQAFWLGAVAVLIAGRWPRGMPPAWSSGKAEPWPSQQELREAREREAAGGGRPRRDVEPKLPRPEPATPSGTPHPSSKKRKRKRRG